MNEIFDGINRDSYSLIGVNFIFKVLFFIVVVFYILYSFLLLLRVRILSDTIETPYNKLVGVIVIGNLLLSLFGSFLAMILILPA